jgi:DNA adenine methylase
MSDNEPLIRPFLKWAGGKRQLLPEIKKHIPKNINTYTYYEPFVGAGALFFELQPKKAVISDFNGQLILTYTVIKENIDELIVLLRKYKSLHNEAHYYETRNVDRNNADFNALTKVEKAARLIYLNKTCFNGLYRVNARGFFNVPLGKYKNPSICDEIALRQISRYLNTNKINIIHKDFASAVAPAGKRSFIYFDPPYHSPDKTSFTGYQADGFGEADQRRLRDVMIKLTLRGAKCLLSNSDTEYIRELYNNDTFDIMTIKAKRAINSNSAARGLVNEVLIKNWRD